jgi:hypothetical protein
VWEDGQAFVDAHAKLRALVEQRESIEAARKATKRRLPLPGQALPETAAAVAAAGGAAAAGSNASGSVLHPDDWLVQVCGAAASRLWAALQNAVLSASVPPLLLQCPRCPTARPACTSKAIRPFNRPSALLACLGPPFPIE